MSSDSARGTALVTSPSSETGRAFVLHLAKKFDIAVNDLSRLEEGLIAQTANKGRNPTVVDGKPLIQASPKLTREKGRKRYTVTSTPLSLIRPAVKSLRKHSVKDATDSSLERCIKDCAAEAQVSMCLHQTYQGAVEQVYKLLPDSTTIGVLSGAESGGRPAWTLVFVGEEGLEGGSVPGSMGPLKSAIRGLTEAAALICNKRLATELGSYGINVNSYFTRALKTTMGQCMLFTILKNKLILTPLIKESAESTTAPVDNLGK
ncbi:hypothetical protein C0992_009217, partial [Termitomyces sp. T32_za158]